MARTGGKTTLFCARCRNRFAEAETVLIDNQRYCKKCEPEVAPEISIEQVTVAPEVEEPKPSDTALKSGRHKLKQGGHRTSSGKTILPSKSGKPKSGLRPKTGPKANKKPTAKRKKDVGPLT